MSFLKFYKVVTFATFKEKKWNLAYFQDGLVSQKMSFLDNYIWQVWKKKTCLSGSLSNTSRRLFSQFYYWVSWADFSEFSLSQKKKRKKIYLENYS